MNNSIRISIATKLILSFLLIIVMTSAIFTALIVVLIADHIRSDVQEQVREDLEIAREIYSNRLADINNVVRSAADRSRAREAASTGDLEKLADELKGITTLEALDILTVTDETGRVLYRTSNPAHLRDDRSHDELVSAVLKYQMPAAATVKIAAEQLRYESPSLARRARLAHTAGSEIPPEGLIEEPDSIMLAAAAPILDDHNTLIGTVYGGMLLSGNSEFVCELQESVFQNATYRGSQVGFVAIYHDDVEALTCPVDRAGTIATPPAKDAFEQVPKKGAPGIGREFLLNNWYITAYQPIRDAAIERIGILQVGTLEQRYIDVRNQIVLYSLAITLSVALVAALFAYLISRRISVPLRRLVLASSDLARGDLDARVDVSSMPADELGELAQAFNGMASALGARDAELRELARTRIRRSQRLALIGKLSANVAHELNNPLQGIVTYSHLLLESMPADHPNIGYVQKIATQADRSRDIIRGLLDFARQREPVKRLCDVNEVLLDCVSLLEPQALFHNVRISRDLDAELPLAVVDPSQIERVFMNMIINAAEAMEGCGDLFLTTRSDPGREHIEIVIADSGHGIPDEDLRRVFDPFFTTKEVGRGTGLGLAISYGITMEHGGTIEVESEVGKGTTFTIRLPVTTESLKLEAQKNGQQKEDTRHR